MRVNDERERAFLTGKTALQSASAPGLQYDVLGACSYTDSVSSISQVSCPGSFPHRVAKELFVKEMP
jgi:hypothetical protein